MSIILEADNRTLTTSAKYSYLVTNYSAGITSFSVLNATDTQFEVDAFLLLGNFGAEDAEVVQIASGDWNTGGITITTPTLFAHAESTRVTILPYDQIRFFHTTTTTFGVGTPLTGYINLQVSDWFTTFSDETYDSGYGWYTFYNSITTTLSQESNPIPYIGFETNTTEQILSDFFSMLNNKELKLVTREDALSWASEAYGRMRNKLNLSSVEYSASGISPLILIPGQIEYDLPNDFDHLVSFMSGLVTTDPGARGSTKLDIGFIPLTEAYTYNGTGPRYYIRGFKIGILPTPGFATTYHYIYQKKAMRLNLNSDEVDLPNGGEYVIKDYMLYRAYQKFQNPQYGVFLKSFTDGMNDMIISAVKRDANKDWWGISREANV
jgi:hypothetical protein